MKKVLIHLAIWVLWYAGTSISSIINYKTEPWLAVFYNYISLAIVFYLSFLLSISYFRRVSISGGLRKMRKRWFRYFLFRREIAGFLGLIIGNIFISWNADHLIFGEKLTLYLSNDFWLYADGKFARMAAYLSAGIAYAVITEIRRRKREIIAQKDAYIASLDAKLEAEKYDNEFLRKKMEEKHERFMQLEQFLKER